METIITWTLIVIFNAGMKDGVSVTINGIPDFEECQKVSLVVQSDPHLIGQKNKFDYFPPENTRSLCLPVTHRMVNKKDIK